MEAAMAERDSWELEEGAEIAAGRSVLKLLGGGHVYEAYLVWDDRLFSIMVAKVLRPGETEDERSLRGLRREAEAFERLAHPVLLRGFGASLEGPYPHVLLEHLEGPTLSRLIRRGGPLALEQALPLLLHVASALHYMASEDMVHLDVKPDNIVMGIPPRLIDFSLVRSVERARRIERPIGTNAYMPPEQCAPHEAGAIGPASDVWGLGATAFHALSGDRPFSRPEAEDDEAPGAARFPQLAEEPKPLPDHVPTELAEAVMACMRKAPEERPAAAEVALSLQPLVAALPEKARLGGRGGR